MATAVAVTAAVSTALTFFSLFCLMRIINKFRIELAGDSWTSTIGTTGTTTDSHDVKKIETIYMLLECCF